jgi:GGDEF domain-containing protein
MTEDWKVNAESKPASLATGDRLRKTTTTGLVLAERVVNAPAGERRVALEKRRRVAKMSKKEMQRLLLTSEVAGLPNRRAFDEAGVADVVAVCDVDGLKALNDQFGYGAGNALLNAMGEALRKTGLEAYHDKGDEFLCRGHSIKALVAKLERARAVLRNHTIFTEKADGRSLTITGADFSYGVGREIHEAESALRSHKTEREGKGEIARGELRGITIKRVRIERIIVRHRRASARRPLGTRYTKRRASSALPR